MMRLVLAALGAAGLTIGLVAPARAQTTATLPVTCNAAGTICTQATPVVNPDGSLVGAGGGGGSASTGTTGAAAPASATQSGGRTAAGNLVAPCVATTGVYCSPVAGTANRVITKTAVSATTSTSICPAATVAVTTEIQVSIASVGLGVNGQTLTSAALGATAADPDIVLPTALTLYVFPVAPTNAVTAYAASAFVAVCIQTLRQ